MSPCPFHTTITITPPTPPTVIIYQAFIRTKLFGFNYFYLVLLIYSFKIIWFQLFIFNNSYNNNGKINNNMDISNDKQAKPNTRKLDQERETLREKSNLFQLQYKTES